MFNTKSVLSVLNRLVDMMKANPEMHIELRSHTDCRQSDEYNMNLSEKRAKAAVAYLIKSGISSKRLKAKGFGESMLINHCECGSNKNSPCTELEHAENRRTEFKIISLK